MKKKTFAIAMLVLICICAVTGGTMAYFTTAVRTNNVITTGQVKIELLETMLDPEDDEEEIPFEDQDHVMPGDTVSKIVRVRNRKEPAYVRVQVTVAAKAGGKDLNPEVIRISHNSQYWTLNPEDGYYYYRSVLATDATTEPLFEEVYFDGTGMDNKYQNAEVTVSVQAHAVQAANNDPEVEGDFSTVQGWPT